MMLCSIVVDDREGQKPDVFVKLIEHSMDRALLLKHPVRAEEAGGMKPRHHAGEFLNQGLVNRLFFVTEDERIPMWHLLRRRHQNLKSPERFVQLAECLIVEGVHQGATMKNLRDCDVVSQKLSSQLA